MTNKKDRNKEKMIKIISAKVDNQMEPDLEREERRSITEHWLHELWNMAFVSGEVAGIKSCKHILNADINELDNIEELGEENIKKTLQ
jgi:hypothetical protein